MADSYHAGKSSRVREICQKLKPILGEQVNSIWLMYLAETEEGKEQIEEYIELLSNQHLAGSLDHDKIMLLPPGKIQVDGEYRLGNVVYNDQILYPFGLRESEFIQHIGIFGRSGSGKTNLGFLIVQRLQEHRKPFMIFDWKRNYRDLLSLPGFETLQIYTVGRDITPLQFNPLIPPCLDDPKSWLKKVIAIISHAYGLGNGVLYLLQEFIDQVYHDAGVYDGPVKNWPTLADVYEVAKNYRAQGRQAGWLASTLRALSSLCFGQMGAMVNKSHDDLDKLFTQPVVLELDALTQADKIFTTEVLLAWLHSRRMSVGIRETFQNCVILEEAHHHITQQRGNLTGGETVIDEIFREIRELGTSLVVLDQHPSQISLPALGNTVCSIAFCMKNKSDINTMAQAMLLKDEEKDIMGSLPVGQAVVKLHGRTGKPFLIQVPEFKIRKGILSDQEVITHMTGLGLIHLPSSSPEIPAQTRQETPGNAFPDQAVLFLMDVHNHPDSGIAQRYTRLNLSVRQGQKLKDKLVGEDLIIENIQTTVHGKVRVIRLTEKGCVKLGESPAQA